MRRRLRITRRVAGGLAIAGALGMAGPAVAARRVLVVSPDRDDGRLETVREAIAYWKTVFAELQLGPPLVDAVVAVKPAGARAIENFAWQISRLAGRLPADTDQPPPPAELLALDSEVVILLSTQPLLPFARPLTERDRYLIAIPRAHDPEDAADRNVIAHELGHVLGLRHGSDPNALMCEPCPGAGGTGEAKLRLISNDDRARLIELHGSPAQ